MPSANVAEWTSFVDSNRTAVAVVVAVVAGVAVGTGLEIIDLVALEIIQINNCAFFSF